MLYWVIKNHPVEGIRSEISFPIAHVDDCLIALNFSRNALISTLFSFLIYDFSLRSYVLCVSRAYRPVYVFFIFSILPFIIPP